MSYAVDSKYIHLAVQRIRDGQESGLDMNNWDTCLLGIAHRLQHGWAPSNRAPFMPADQADARLEKLFTCGDLDRRELLARYDRLFPDGWADDTPQSEPASTVVAAVEAQPATHADTQVAQSVATVARTTPAQPTRQRGAEYAQQAHTAAAVIQQESATIPPWALGLVRLALTAFGLAGVMSIGAIGLLWRAGAWAWRNAHQPQQEQQSTALAIRPARRQRDRRERRPRRLLTADPGGVWVFDRTHAEKRKHDIFF